MAGHRGSMVLVTLGNIMVATAQWYLIWLFAREAGPQAVGIYSSLLAYMTPIFIFAQLGLRNLYITLQSAVTWSVYLAIRIGGIIIAGTLALGVLAVFAPNAAWPMGVAILLIKTASSAADLYFARLQRSECLRTFGILLILDAACTAVVTTAVMTYTGSVEFAVFAAAAVAVASASATILLALRKTVAQTDPSAGRFGPNALTLIRHGAPLALSQGLQSVLTYLPLAVVGWLGSTGDIGVYSSAAYLVTFANLLGASVQITVLTDYRRRFEESGKPRFRQMVRKNSVITVAVMSPLVALAVIIGPFFLTLVYGADFDISRLSVLFFSLSAVIVLPSYLLSSLHLVLNHYWVMTIVGAASIVAVVFAGGAAGYVGAGPVEAGSLAVLASAVARYMGADFLSSHTLSLRRTSAPKQKAGLP